MPKYNLLDPRLPKLGGGGGGGGGKVSCNNFLTKKDIEMKSWLVVNRLTKNL